MLEPTALDKRIATLFPQWGSRRMRARREFAYEAAINTRLRGRANRLTGPEDFTAFPDRMQLIREMRDLEQNFGLFQSMIDKLALYGFGRLRYQARTGDDDINDQYESYLAQRFKGLSLCGRFNLRNIACLAFKSHLRDGDCALKWQRNAGDLKLVGIEGDRLGGNYLVSPLEDYFQGVTINIETGEPLTYRVYQRTKANTYINPQEVPAADVLHFFDPRRFDQYRGITPFAPVINEARDLKELLAACLIGTKFENMHGAIGYTESGLPINDPGTFIDGPETTARGGTIKEQEIKPGLIQWAPSGSKYEFLKSDRPSGQFQTYLEMLVHLLCSPLNLSYGFVYSLTGLSGPAVRMASQQDHRTIQWHQANMTDRILEPVKNMLLIDGIAGGAVEYSPQFANGKWQFPPDISIDAGRDSAAGINENKAGLLSKSSWFSDLGEDAEEQAAIIEAEAQATIEAAQRVAKATGVQFEQALDLIELRTANGSAAGGGGARGGGGAPEVG